MGKKKSLAQIRRNKLRAEKRGECYTVPDAGDAGESGESGESGDAGDAGDAGESGDAGDAGDAGEEPPSPQASSPSPGNHPIEDMTSMTSKERRAYKRKMKALGIPIPEDNPEQANDRQAESGETSHPSQEQREQGQQQIPSSPPAGMNAKERRKYKRKLEAIEAEETNTDVKDLRKEKKAREEEEEEEESGHDDALNGGKESHHTNRTRNPLIVFVGQLSFETTKENLLEHIKKECGNKAAKDVTIRILTGKDPPHKSRGMAFVEATDPELLYELLKLHHTTLNGRRMNVERSAGGGKGSSRRAEKLKSYRDDQTALIDERVGRILKEYADSGQLEEGELDEGVINLCKRHSANTVQQALTEYVESRGENLNNPSSYLTSIIGRVAQEGIEKSEEDRKFHAERKGKPTRTSGRGSDSGSGNTNGQKKDAKSYTPKSRTSNRF